MCVASLNFQSPTEVTRNKVRPQGGGPAQPGLPTPMGNFSPPKKVNTYMNTPKTQNTMQVKHLTDWYSLDGSGGVAHALLQLLPPANTVLEHINAKHIAARMEQLAKQEDGYLDFEQHLMLSNELDDIFSRWVDDLLIRHKEMSLGSSWCLPAHLSPYGIVSQTAGWLIYREGVFGHSYC